MSWTCYPDVIAKIKKKKKIKKIKKKLSSVWILALRGAQVRLAKFYLWVSRCFFLGVNLFWRQLPQRACTYLL